MVVEEKPKIKAYSVSDANGEKSVLVFAEAEGKAKSLASQREELDGVDYIDLHARRAYYADGHENDSESDLRILNIRNGWWYEIGNHYIDADNLDEMIAKGII